MTIYSLPFNINSHSSGLVLLIVISYFDLFNGLATFIKYLLQKYLRVALVLQI